MRIYKSWHGAFYLIGLAMNCCAYIDGANLYQGAKDRGGIHYEKFMKWLSDKYKVSKVFLFVGYIKGNETLYSELSQLGYILVFKETLEVDGKIKGNCDTELAVQSVSDFYEKSSQKVLLISGDGDFGCVVDFFKKKQCHIILLAPNRKYCSYLLKKRNIPIVFLEEQKHKYKKSPQ